jgi:hypothetical protein
MITKGIANPLPCDIHCRQLPFLTQVRSTCRSNNLRNDRQPFKRVISRSSTPPRRPSTTSVHAVTGQAAT